MSWPRKAVIMVPAGLGEERVTFRRSGRMWRLVKGIVAALCGGRPLPGEPVEFKGYYLLLKAVWPVEESPGRSGPDAAK